MDPHLDEHDDPFAVMEPPSSRRAEYERINGEESSQISGNESEPLQRKRSSPSATTVRFLADPITWIRQDLQGFETKPNEEGQKLKMTGFITALAIAIHNFPEGLATFVGALADPSVGIALAVAIAIHNVPEGICVAIPIYYATGSRLRAFFWAFVSGLSEPLGAGIGWAIISIADSDIMFGILFGIVSGMMVYISIAELLPTAHRYDPHDRFVTISCVTGMMIMAGSLLLFEY